MLRPILLTTFLTLTCAAKADVPRVVTDIAPIHSLAAQVMGDLGTPTLLIDAGASPHSFALRPSQAAALEQAQTVFWVGEGLTPWLAAVLDRLAKHASPTELLDVSGTHLLPLRDDDDFATDDHGHDEGHDEGAHDDHDHHGDFDPHAWLDPENGKVWLSAIAARLEQLDPEHGPIYQENARKALGRLDQLTAQIEATFASDTPPSFVVFHDAYHYFEARFDVEAATTIALSDATPPGPARVEKVQNLIREKGINCAFSEPQFSQALVATVLEGTDAKSATLDPLGAELAPGSGLYEALLTSMATAISGC